MRNRNISDALALLGALLFGLLLWPIVALHNNDLNDRYMTAHGGEQQRPGGDISPFKSRVICGPVVAVGLVRLVGRSRRRATTV